MSHLSIEQVLLARAQPHVLLTRAQMIQATEACKGCSGAIARYPVALEPSFQPILGGLSPDAPPAESLFEAPIPPDQLVRARLWVATEQACDWNRSELFVKGLSRARRRVTLNIFGNREEIVQQIVCHVQDVPVVQSAFSGWFEQSVIAVERTLDPLVRLPVASWGNALYLDFYPPPFYAHLLTCPQELKRSPYATLFASLQQLGPPAVGLFQVLLQPVSPDHDWGDNIRVLTDLEYELRQLSGFTGFERYAQQVPSGDRHHMAVEIITKAHNDKPLYAVALRLAVVDAGPDAEAALHGLSVATSGIQHGGRPLRYLTADDYRDRVPASGVRSMFVGGAAYRPGFLLNSAELTSLVHVPPPDTFVHIRTIVRPLEVLPVPEELRSGSPIGICSYAGTPIPVCVPQEDDEAHLHVIGSTNTGKSTLLIHRILYHIQRQYGVAVLDPHGALIWKLLELIPPEETDRVIYFNPGDPDWTPCYNIFACGVQVGPGRVTDDVVRCFKSFLTGWGDRLEHLLRHALFAVLHLPESNLRDVADLLRKKSRASRRIRDRLRAVLGNESARTFWEEDFDGYGQADLSPPAHKLSKLLVSDTLGRMLSQDGSRFNLRDIMDSGKILLIDLSQLGSEERDVLGCLLLSLLHLTALGRKGDGSDRPFRIYCDEAHRLLTDAMEDMLNEARKFGISLTLAHQQLEQFNTRKIHALSSVGSAIIFRVIQPDAQYLAKTLQGKIDPTVLETLEKGEVVARVGNRIVRARTCPPAIPTDPGARARILARSRELYYRPSAVVDAEIRARGDKWQDPGEPRRDSLPPACPVAEAGVGQPNGGEHNNPLPEAHDYESF